MQWRDPPGSFTKHKVCQEIVDMLCGKGCHKPIDAMIIYNKIQHIEGKMRQCYNQYAGTKTGNGLKEINPIAYKDKVLFHILFIISYPFHHLNHLF